MLLFFTQIKKIYYYRPKKRKRVIVMLSKKNLFEQTVELILESSGKKNDFDLMDKEETLFHTNGLWTQRFLLFYNFKKMASIEISFYSDIASYKLNYINIYFFGEKEINTKEPIHGSEYDVIDLVQEKFAIWFKTEFFKLSIVKNSIHKAFEFGEDGAYRSIYFSESEKENVIPFYGKNKHIKNNDFNISFQSGALLNDEDELHVKVTYSFTVGSLKRSITLMKKCDADELIEEFKNSSLLGSKLLFNNKDEMFNSFLKSVGNKEKQSLNFGKKKSSKVIELFKRK